MRYNFYYILILFVLLFVLYANTEETNQKDESSSNALVTNPQIDTINNNKYPLRYISRFAEKGKKKSKKKRKSRRKRSSKKKRSSRKRGKRKKGRGKKANKKSGKRKGKKAGSKRGKKGSKKKRGKKGSKKKKAKGKKANKKGKKKKAKGKKANKKGKKKKAKGKKANKKGKKKKAKGKKANKKGKKKKAKGKKANKKGKKKKAKGKKANKKGKKKKAKGKKANKKGKKKKAKGKKANKKGKKKKAKGKKANKKGKKKKAKGKKANKKGKKGRKKKKAKGKKANKKGKKGGKRRNRKQGKKGGKRRKRKQGKKGSSGGGHSGGGGGHSGGGGGHSGGGGGSSGGGGGGGSSGGGDDDDDNGDDDDDDDSGDSDGTNCSITKATLKSACPNLSQSKINAYVGPLNKALKEGKITTHKRLACFMAQVAHESGCFKYFEELASGKAYNGRKDLGNTKPGDGPRFKGRGPIQLTGRANYRAAGKALGLDLVKNPKQVATPKVGFRTTVWFWTTRKLNGYCDKGDFLKVTKRINGGTNGLADRKKKWAKFKKIIKCEKSNKGDDDDDDDGDDDDDDDGSVSDESDCGPYKSKKKLKIKGNGGKTFTCVKIEKKHWSYSKAELAKDPTKKDNSMTYATACAFNKMWNAAKKKGVKITINSGFRTIARQKYFYNCYKTKKCNGGRQAAKPGRSNHGVGTALDLNSSKKSSAQYKWLAKNAHKYGFKRTVKSEAWHWVYQGGPTKKSSFT